MKNDIDIFNYLDDTGLSYLNFDFSSKKASLEFLFWDDLKRKEVPLTLFFSGVNKFKSDYPENEAFNVVGCHEANCISTGENKYEVNFLFDFLNQAVSWKVEIGFEKVEFKGGLSKEAFDYKFARA